MPRHSGFTIYYGGLICSGVKNPCCGRPLVRSIMVPVGVKRAGFPKGKVNHVEVFDRMLLVVLNVHETKALLVPAVQTKRQFSEPYQ